MSKTRLLTITAALVLAASCLHARTLNVQHIGAQGDGERDDTAAIQRAIDTLQREGGGTVFLPEGTYRISPQTAETAQALLISGDNIELRGEGPEKTVLSFRTHGNRDPVEQWTITDNGDLRRGHGIRLAPADRTGALRNITIRDLRLTGNAPPTGRGFWPADPDSGDGWDVTHKGICIGPDRDIDNVVIDNCHVDNWRGEIIYSGGDGIGSVRVLNSKIWGTNGSAISTSADFFCDNIEVWDAVHSCVESIHLTGGRVIQNGTYLNSTFEPNRSLPANGRYGLNVMNDDGSSVTVRNCTIKNALHHGIFLTVASHDALFEDNTLIDCGLDGGFQYGYFTISPGSNYGVDGAVRNVTFRGNTIRHTADRRAGFVFAPGSFADSPMENLVIEENTIEAGGAGIRRFVYDAYPHAHRTRPGFVIRNNRMNRVEIVSEDSAVRDTPAFRPIWENNHFDDPGGFHSGTNLFFSYDTEPMEIAPYGPVARITDTGGSEVELRIREALDRYPDGFTVELRFALRGSKSVVLKPDSAWNRFTERRVVSQETLILGKRDGKFEILESADAGP